MARYRLELDIRSDWHSGTGRGASYHLDALTHRGADGLPELPGRSVKGLLRDAVLRAERFGWYGADTQLSERLFGVREGTTRAGALRVGDARLPDALRARLSASDSAPLRAALTRSLFSTAVDPRSGRTRDHTLRGIEVAIPMRLLADIDCIAPQQAGPDWPELLRRALPLLRALGANRHRGFGRVQARLLEVA